MQSTEQDTQVFKYSQGVHQHLVVLSFPLLQGYQVRHQDQGLHLVQDDHDLQVGHDGQELQVVQVLLVSL